MSDRQAAAREWAERTAANLPPLTAEQAADVGRIAATLDARRERLCGAVHHGMVCGLPPNHGGLHRQTRRDGWDEWTDRMMEASGG